MEQYGRFVCPGQDRLDYRITDPVSVGPTDALCLFLNGNNVISAAANTITTNYRQHFVATFDDFTNALQAI